MNNPREGPLRKVSEGIYQSFCLFQKQPKVRIIMDTNDLQINSDMMKELIGNISDESWAQFYRDTRGHACQNANT